MKVGIKTSKRKIKYAILKHAQYLTFRIEELRSEILVQAETVQLGCIAPTRRHDVGFLVLPHLLLEEVRLAL